MNGIFAIALFVAAVEPVEAPKEASLDAIRKHLRQRLAETYDGGREAGRLTYDPKAKLQVVKVAELAGFFPKTTFFTTTLDTPFLDYRQVRVLVCYTRADGKVKIRRCLSPLYTTVSEDLLSLFADVPAKTAKQRRDLAAGLGKLLVAITVRGDVEGLDSTDRVTRFQLMHHDRIWRDVELRYSDSGTVSRVLVAKPKRKTRATGR